jgi:hypothetical protein
MYRIPLLNMHQLVSHWHIPSLMVLIKFAFAGEPR